jgi:dihydroflavonol-4-reductase
MKVLVTGATGLLGSHVLEQGIARGHKIRAVVREVSSRTYLAKHQNEIEEVVCDLTEHDLLPENLSGIDAIVHCAALASTDPSDLPRMEEINDRIPRKLFSLAEKAGVPKWVQVSTTAVLTNPAKPVFTEEDFGSLRDTPYARTKYAFDLFLAANSKKMETLTVHPGYMLGRWDAKPSSGAVLFGLRLGRFKHYVDRSKSFVAASDVASGLWQALEANAKGRYILTGENAKISEFMKQACLELGMPFDMKAIDIEAMEALNGVERSFVREFCLSGAASHEKAKNAFNYSPSISVSAMIKEAVDYFIENRMLKRASK